MSSRVTLKTIAQKCGVSVATVSYAMRNDSRISEATRKRIHDTAEKLDYRPDPMLASLVSYRTSVSSPRFKASVAVLHVHPKDSRRTLLFERHRNSFQEQIMSYGYSVTDFFVDSGEYTSGRLAQILHARGVLGVILAWGNWENILLEFPWNEFVAVSSERNAVHSSIDRVSINHFHGTDEVFQRMKALGHKRVGLIHHNDLPIRVEKNILGAYYSNLHQNKGMAKGIPPFVYSLGENPERFKAWFEQHKPEGIISHRLIDESFFKNAGIEFPQDAHYAVVEIDEEASGNAAGITVNDDMGRTLANILAGKLHNNELVDLNREGMITLVNGSWKPGKTLGSS